MSNKALVLPMLACCALTAETAAEPFASDLVITEPSTESFSVCFDHGCNSVVPGTLTAAEWDRFIAPLRIPAADAEAERKAIAHAIGTMETIIGDKTGTHADRGGNLEGFGRPMQMDCIDESTNTHTYLKLLEGAGLLTRHSLSSRSTRFGIFAGMPHTTAVITDLDTGTRYAVDSWFYDNGMPPAIVELSAWKSGWRP